MKSTNAWVVLAMLAACGLLVWVLSASRMVPETLAPAIAPDDYTKGAEHGRVVVIEYLDFECEACGAYYPVIKTLEKEYGDRVTFVARYFPLPGHRNGLPAALAAEAAGRQGKFWEMHDLLFTNQKDWGEKQAATPEAFEKFAEQLDLDMEKFRIDVASAEVRARVQRDLDEGRKAGVTGTPGFFLNGERLPNPGSEAAFRKVLDDELSANPE